MAEFRVYIDESGDHTYRSIDELSKRYLGLTGVVINQRYYISQVPDAVETLKKKYFRYDPDNPPIFVRSRIIKRLSSFWVLRDKNINNAWEADLLGLLSSLQAQIFTVVMDKKQHKERFPIDTWNPYVYCLSVLLNRIRGWLNFRRATADVMPEVRGAAEDRQLLAAYTDLRTNGDTFGYATGDDYRVTYPVDELLFRKKEHNVAGLQIADLVAAEQKMLVVEESELPLSSPIGPFGERLNDAIRLKVNRHGRYLLK